MRADAEGFLQPIVSSNKCIACGKCEKVCPVLNQSVARHPLQCFAAKSMDSCERLCSSSGGIFSLLARNIIERGGIVFGAAWMPECSKVVHIGVERIQDLPRLRESKYVQSEIGEAYKKCGQYLDEGRLVLFTGCPCQIAGLRSFLDYSYEKLVTMEVICNSVPSPKALAAWTSTEKRKAPDEDLIAIHFRDKSLGWHNTTLKYQFTTTTTTTNLQLSAYYKLWQKGFTVRRSCVECRFRDFRSGADMTIGDFWGIERVIPEIDDNSGISAVIVNTEKGRDLWSKITGGAYFRDAVYTDILHSNPCLHKSFDLLKTAGDKRDIFWTLVNNGSDLQKLGIKMTQDPVFHRIRLSIGRFLRKLGLRK